MPGISDPWRSKSPHWFLWGLTFTPLQGDSLPSQCSGMHQTQLTVIWKKEMAKKRPDCIVRDIWNLKGGGYVSSSNEIATDNSQSNWGIMTIATCCEPWCFLHNIVWQHQSQLHSHQPRCPLRSTESIKFSRAEKELRFGISRLASMPLSRAISPAALHPMIRSRPFNLIPGCTWPVSKWPPKWAPQYLGVKGTNGSKVQILRIPSSQRLSVHKESPGEQVGISPFSTISRTSTIFMSQRVSTN